MKVNIIISLSCLSLICFGCKTSGNNAKETNEVLRIQDQVAYDLDPQNFYTNLPDSLGGKNWQGRAAVVSYINKKGKYLGFNLVKLSLKEKSGAKKISFLDTNLPSNNQANFTSIKSLIKEVDSYPQEVRKYHKFIQLYLRRLNYRKVQQVESKAITAYSFLLRFNKS